MSNHLDDLMLSYLDALDTYQSLRASLSTHFTAGFLALARANFHSPNNTRYGSDAYDERMSAQLGVRVDSSGREFGSLRIAAAGEEKGDCRDPLRWFGILVPRALRTAKMEFGKAVEEVVPALLTARARVLVLQRRIECAKVGFVYMVLKTAPVGGEVEGLCTAGQVAGGLRAGGGEVGRVWVVKVSCGRVGADLEWGEGEGGEWFPRLGRGVGEGDVVGVREFERGEGEEWDGVFDGVEWLEG
ncbi:hypothetical protein Q9L58_005967 [Maublancomyces gigas]|uniref:Vacuolar ATPase assembly protein VMA22 n=1 Tax=Discina gigas TaxID=1032678 RepID=A0ABR3GGR2_9PEZI